MTGTVLRLVPPGAADADEVLIARCASGDAEALGALYDRWSAPVWRFLSRFLGHDCAELDDLAQATFVEVWRSARQFRGDASARVWIFGIAHNLARHHIRSKTRQRALFGVLSQAAPARPRLADAEVEDRRAVERVAAALPLLSEDQRAAFVLCDLEGVRGVDAAEILGIKPGTLGRRLHDARMRLRRALEGDTP